MGEPVATDIRGMDRRHLMATLSRRLRLFQREEDGVMLVFSISVFMLILLIGGIGVDLMRHEMVRTRLQSTLDRAVLAAADLDQTLSPTAVVNDYFAKAGMSDFLTEVVVSQGINFRTVSASAEIEMNTTLMHLAGIPTLVAPAAGTAEERIGKVEISLVLDISGSMRDNNRMINMQNAAKIFVDTVLKAETADQISVTLVPYSEHVNIGLPLFSLLNKHHRHPYSHCLEIPASHFTQVSINQAHVYEQAQHFQWNWNGTYNPPRTDTVCPRYSYETIRAFSRNASALKTQIDQLRPRAGTSIFLGMKWAVGLLDPQASNLVSGLIAQGHVEPIFAGRPAPYSDAETLKTVVLMTDGENFPSNRINPSYYANSGHYAHWNNWNFNWYIANYVSWNRNNWWYVSHTAAQGNQWLGQVCTAAKNAGIVVWGIGFEVTNDGANIMRNCASSPSHFFRVEGIEIRDAFQAIARQINQLRLTQ